MGLPRFARNDNCTIAEQSQKDIVLTLVRHCVMLCGIIHLREHKLNQLQKVARLFGDPIKSGLNLSGSPRKL
jgi:hypothetical protein